MGLSWKLLSVAIDHRFPPFHQLLLLQYVEPRCDHRLIHLVLIYYSSFVCFLLLFDDKVFKIVVLHPSNRLNFVRIDDEARIDVFPCKYNVV